MTEEEVVALMKSSTSETEWNANADVIKRLVTATLRSGIRLS